MNIHVVLHSVGNYICIVTLCQGFRQRHYGACIIDYQRILTGGNINAT